MIKNCKSHEKICGRESKRDKRNGGVNGMCVFYETGVLNLILVIGVVHQKQRARPKLHEDTYNNRGALIRTKRSQQSDQRTKKSKRKQIYPYHHICGLCWRWFGSWHCVCCGGGDMESPKIKTKIHYVVICGQHLISVMIIVSSPTWVASPV